MRKLVHLLILAVPLSFGHLFIFLMVEQPFTGMQLAVCIGIYFTIKLLTAYCCLIAADREYIPFGTYLVMGISIAGLVLLADYASSLVLFRDFLSLKADLLTLSIIITLGVAFASIRIVSMLSQTCSSFWLKLSASAIGLSLSGIPIMVMYSLVETSALLPSRYISMPILAPFLTEAFFLLILWLIPDYLLSKTNREQKAELLEQQHHYKSLFEHNLSAVFTCDVNGVVVNSNQKASEFLGYHAKELLGKHILTAVHTADKGEVKALLQNALDGEASNMETRVIRRDGTSTSLRLKMVPIKTGEIVKGIFAITEDLSEIKQKDEKISFIAFHDELTGLKNRSFLIHEIEKLRMAGDDQFSVFYLDINGFKKWNDLYTQSFGDKLLYEVAERFQRKVSTNGSLFVRFNGDDFGLLLRSKQKHRQEEVLLQLREALHHPIIVQNQECYVSASYGIAAPDSVGFITNELLKNAETAMRYAKQSYDDHAYYGDEIQEERIQELFLEKELRIAIERKDLHVHYQPKINSRYNSLAGLEALVRWRHAEKGMVPPGVFIPIAERNGLIVPLERIVFEEVCQDIASLLNKGQLIKRVSVNISQIHLYQEDFSQFIISCLKKYNIHPTAIELEITESVIMMDDLNVIQRLEHLKEMGVEISMDDFGTGYSSLSYINKLPIDRIKIDKSFIDQIEIDEQYQTIIKTIVSMARHLRLEVIAEGVETEKQMLFLKSVNCFHIQGYFYYAPMTFEKVRELLYSEELLKEPAVN